MDDLLTTKQVQTLLQIDRTTVYRMLKDGRLPGVKVGHQWRFRSTDVEAFLSGEPQSLPPAEQTSPSQIDVFPISCVQSVQDVCAEMGSIGALTTDIKGNPLTEISNCSPFCRLILDSESGYAACQKSWETIAGQKDTQPRFLTCHAGFQYARAYIQLNGSNEAMFIGGQFYTIPPTAQEAEKNARRLAEEHDIDPVALLNASHSIPFLNSHQKREITNWLTKVADTFSQISQERFDLIQRLKRISKMSSLDID